MSKTSRTGWLVALGALLALTAGCFNSGDYPTDFKVISTAPAATQTNVPVNSQVVVRFTNPPDHKTIQNTKQVILVDHANTVVPSTFTFKGELLFITPISPMASGQTYGIAVREGVRDIFGSNIEVPYAATFSTGQTVMTIPNFPPFQVTPTGGPAPGGTPGTFSPTGQLVYARARHRMTRLVDNRVLAAGGENDGPLGRVLRSAEIFDPTNFQWTLSTSLGNGVNGMNYERYGHTQTLLKDGRVLIAGGTDNHKVLDVAELYNPMYDVFAAIPARMVNTRVFHTAELLDNGNVILIGGWSNTQVASAAINMVANQLGVMQGIITMSYLLDSMEVYDVYSGTFTPTAQPLLPLQTPNPNFQTGWGGSPVFLTPAGRMHHTSNRLPDGGILVAGGYSEPWLNQAVSTDDAQIYVPDNTGSGVNGITVHPGTNLTVPRVCHTSTLLLIGDGAGMVVLYGGFSNSPYTGVLPSGEVYDPQLVATSGQYAGQKGCFTPLAQQMSVPRHNHTASPILQGLHTEGVLLAGGAMHMAVQNPFPPLPYARLYPWLEPTGCGACRLTFSVDMFQPFGFGKNTMNPYRGVNLTGQLVPLQDVNGNPADLQQIYTQGVYFHAAVNFPNGSVLIAGGAWCPFCLMGPNAWSTYFTNIIGLYRVGGTSCIYNP